MADVLKNRIQERTTTTGTGTLTLTGAVAQYQSFSVIGNGNSVNYTLLDANGTGWEVGQGSWATGNLLGRDVVFESSAAGAKITLSTGTHTVFATLTAQTNIFTGKQTISPSSSVYALALQANASQTFNAPLLFFADSSGAEIGRLNFNIGTAPGYSVFIGYHTGNAITVTGTGTDGLYNVFVGYDVGGVATKATYNVGIGTHALTHLTEGYSNVGVGPNALGEVTTGYENVAIGRDTLQFVTTGHQNMGIGQSALKNATGNNSTGLGNLCGWQLTTGQYHTLVGSGAGSGLVASDGCVLVGINAGSSLTGSGASYNTFIGYLADTTSSSATNSIAIGANASVSGSNLAVIGASGTAIKLGINMTTPTARLHLPAGSTTVAPLKLTSGTNLTTAEDGAFEYNGTTLFFTVGSTRKTVTLT